MTGSELQEIKIQKLSDFWRLKDFESWQCCSEMLRNREISYYFLICATLHIERFLAYMLSTELLPLLWEYQESKPLYNHGNTKTACEVLVLQTRDEIREVNFALCPVLNKLVPYLDS